MMIHGNHISRRAFTLVEVLLASIIFLAAMSATYSMLLCVLRTERDAQVYDMLMQENNSVIAAINYASRKSSVSAVKQADGVFQRSEVFQPGTDGISVSWFLPTPTAGASSVSVAYDTADRLSGSSSVSAVFHHDPAAGGGVASVAFETPFRLQSGADFCIEVKSSGVQGSALRVRLFTGSADYYSYNVDTGGVWSMLRIGSGSWTKSGAPSEYVRYLVVESDGAGLPEAANVTVKVGNAWTVTNGASNSYQALNSQPYGNCITFSQGTFSWVYVYSPEDQGIYDGNGRRLINGKVKLYDGIPFADMSRGYPVCRWYVADDHGSIFDFQAGGESRYGR